MDSSEADYLTPEEVSQQFNAAQQRCFQFEENCSDADGMSYAQVVTQLSKLQQSIIHHSLFSPNEQLHEIATENLKYLLLPYYMGFVSARMVTDRKKNLEFAQLYFGEYLKLLNHYELVSKDQKKQWKNLSDDGNYIVSREDKIQSYKDQKALENKLNNLESIKEETDRREVVMTQISISVYKTIDTLRSNLQEVEILEYKELIEKDPKAKEQHEKMMNKPLPKPTVTKIAKQEDKSVPFLLEQHKGKVDYLCGGCAQTMEEHRHELRQQVFTPGTTMPTVTLDQLADIEIANMQRTEESSKQAKKRQEEQDDADSDRDSVGDAKQDEARRWDDWKDENEKGAGNRFGK